MLREIDFTQNIKTLNVKPYTNKITQVTDHKCFGSAIYYDCISSKVDVSMGKTWISPTANSSYNPPRTLKLDQMACSASSDALTSHQLAGIAAVLAQKHGTCTKTYPHDSWRIGR